MNGILESLAIIIRDGITFEELALFSVLAAAFVLCVYAATQALVKIVQCITEGTARIFGTSVQAISDGIRSGGKALLSPTSKEPDRDSKSY